MESKLTVVKAALLALVVLTVTVAVAAPLGVPKFRQRGENDCGPAAAASVAKYWQGKGHAVEGKTIDEMYENAKRRAGGSQGEVSSDKLANAVDEATKGTSLTGHGPATAAGYTNFDFIKTEFAKGQTIIINIKATGTSQGSFGHYMVINDVRPAGPNACSLQVMNPATGEYEWYVCSSAGGKLTFPYDGGTATVNGLRAISPESHVESKAETLASGKIRLTYDVYPAPSTDTTQRVKDFHLVVSDTGKVKGVPPGWRKRWVRDGRGWRLDIYDSCQTPGLQSPATITVTLPGGRKVKKIWSRVTLTKSGDKENPPKAPDRIWHKWAVATVCAEDWRSPSATTCCAVMPGGGNDVVLSWAHSSDNQAVTGYRLANVTRLMPDTAVTDTWLVLAAQEPNVLHSYVVSAFDSSANHSGFGPRVGFLLDEAGRQPTLMGTMVTNSFFSSLMWLDNDREVRLTFDEVLASGETRVDYFLGNRVDPPIGPSELRAMDPVYHITSSATTAGPLILEIPWCEFEEIGMLDLPRMYQLVGNTWMDITNSVDPGRRVVIGFSPFGLQTDGSGVFALAYHEMPGGDIACRSFSAPTTTTIAPGGYFAPSVVVVNTGPSVRSFPVVCEANGVPADTQWVVNLTPGDWTDVWFDCAALGPGESLRLKAWAALAGDVNPANDTSRLLVTALPAAWTELEPMPLLPSNRDVKQGGWLAVAGSGRVVAAKGNRTGDFYEYDMTTGEWADRRPIGQGTSGPSESGKGGRGVSDGDRMVYVTLGRNTDWFLRYDIAADSWYACDPVPSEPSGRAVKDGTDMVYVERQDTGWVYLLKGYDTDFYKYNTVTNRWVVLPSAPDNVKAKYKAGSWLAYDGAGFIYCQKAQYYNRSASEQCHELYRFDVSGDTWCRGVTLHGTPIDGTEGGRTKKKKFKDGGCAAWQDGWIVALKGGNSQQFWAYEVSADSWRQLDTMPRPSVTGGARSVKSGADIVAIGNGVFLALKGNKTRQFWCYAWAPVSENSAGRGDAVRTGVLRPSLVAAVSHITAGWASVDYVLPGSGPARLVVRDATGREALRRAAAIGERGRFRFETGELAAGVYLVSLDRDGTTVTSKFVLTR